MTRANRLHTLMAVLCLILPAILLASCMAAPTPEPTQTHLRTPVPASTATETPSPTRRPTRTPSPTPSRTPTVTPQPFAWTRIAPGVSQADVPVPIDGTDQFAYIYALRINPEAVTITVAYREQGPQSIEDWQHETGAPIVMNAGFFSGSGRPVGRLIVDGRLYGGALRYEEDSVSVPGLFTVLDGRPEIFALGRSTYNPRALRFDYAVECYPVLLLPGGQPTFPVETEKAARRSIVALDTDGNLVLVFSNLSLFTLHEAANWLAISGLNLDTALNFDGGRSSGLAVRTGAEEQVYPSVVQVPSVLVIYTR